MFVILLSSVPWNALRQEYTPQALASTFYIYAGGVKGVSMWWIKMLNIDQPGNYKAPDSCVCRVLQTRP